MRADQLFPALTIKTEVTKSLSLKDYVSRKTRGIFKEIQPTTPPLYCTDEI